MFTGRIVQPGEPEFLAEDTDGALALAEEERATCPSCGLLKAWCREPANQFAFEVHEEQCHASYAVEAHKESVNGGRSAATRVATRISARLREDVEPDLLAGLPLESGHGPEDGAE